MKIISIGSTCQVKNSIDLIFKQEETNFFDWLITDFKSVLYVLKHNNDTELITPSKFTNEEGFIAGRTFDNDHHKMGHIYFKMISVHDFPLETPYMDMMNTFIEKYKRRLHRLIELIHSEDNIHMIHCLDHIYTDTATITSEDIYNYKLYLSNINQNHQCYLHIAIPPKYNHIDFNHLIQDRVFVYYLRDTKNV